MICYDFPDLWGSYREYTGSSNDKALPLTIMNLYGDNELSVRFFPIEVRFIIIFIVDTCTGITAVSSWHGATKHYNDVIMGAIASKITSLTIVYSTVYSGVDQRKHESSASLAFVWGIHRGPVNSLHKGPVTRKMFPFDDVIMDLSGSVELVTSSIHFLSRHCAIYIYHHLIDSVITGFYNTTNCRVQEVSSRDS